jgi:hypothetical protein
LEKLARPVTEDGGNEIDGDSNEARGLSASRRHRSLVTGCAPARKDDVKMSTAREYQDRGTAHVEERTILSHMTIP